MLRRPEGKKLFQKLYFSNLIKHKTTKLIREAIPFLEDLKTYPIIGDMIIELLKSDKKTPKH